MNLGISDKVMIVTGGSQGIGEAISRAIGHEGGVPIIIDRSRKTGEKLQNDLRKKGIETWFIEIELSSVENCKRAVEIILKKYGKIDALFNNAGSNDVIGLEKGSPSEFLNSLNENLYHYYYMAHFSLSALMKTKGTIINISSKTAVTGQGGTSGYAASKGAQLALTREWAVELLPYNIRVNAIIPAEVMTSDYKRWIQSFENPENKLANIEANIPLGNRMTKKEEVASMAVYLASEHASHITGQFLYVDGGYVHLDRAFTGKGKI